MKTMIQAVAVVGMLAVGGAALAKGKTAKVEGVVNLNTATVQQIDAVPGVTPKQAKAVVDYRTTHPFARPEEIVRVKGIKKKKFERIRTYLAVSGPTTLHALAKTKRQARTAAKK